MADNTINVKIREAYDTETNWNQKNPVLLQGQVAISSDKHGMYKVGDGTKTWQQLNYASHPASDVYSWAKAQTKPSYTKSEVGLGNVDNTSDANKPISTATQAALDAKQATITGAATTITGSNLTASRALVSNSSGKVAVSAVTSTELGYLDGVTSSIQTQLNGKQASITGGATTITQSDLTASRALISNASGKVAVSDITSTELGYLDGVTQSIQTQLNGKAASGHNHDSTYLKLAGGTMTGVLTLKGNQYSDSFSSGGLDANNSNLYNVNSIYFADAADATSEGLQFYRDSTHADVIRATGGRVYFTPNRKLGEAGTSYEMLVLNPDERSKIPDQLLDWGTKKLSGDYNYGDSLINTELSANRFAGLKAAGITIEYSRDSGDTWTDYGATDLQKRYLFTEAAAAAPSFRVGGASGDTTTAGQCQLRVTIDTATAVCYTNLRKLHIYISTSYSNGSKVTIKCAQQSDPNTYNLTLCEDQSIAGWSGWNVIPCNITTYGNQAAHYRKIQFTFKTNGVAQDHVGAGLTIYRIRGYGGVGWSSASNMALNGKLYQYKFTDGSSNPHLYVPTEIESTNYTGKVNGFTIGTNVPADAKFTDTTALGSMTGTLSIDHGGTGKTTAGDAANVLLNGLGVGSSIPVDADYYISQYVGGGTTTTTYHRRPMSALWSYVKGKTDSNYLKLTGGTVSGPITLYRESTTTQDYPAQLVFSVKDTTTGKQYSAASINVYNDHTTASATYGTNMVIHSDGNIFLGSGEAPGSHYALYKGNTSENTFISADDAIHIQANANTIGNRLGVQINTAGALLPEKADTATNNSGSIGNSSYKWADVYATNLHGNLTGDVTGDVTGNASSATTATTATTADKLTGFSSRSASFTWGNQTGTAITCLNDSTGGSIGFRRDNPSSGKMQMVIDGTVYVSEGQNEVYHAGNKPTKADVGLGNVENKSSATIRGELTSSNVTTALGFTPAKQTDLSLKQSIRVGGFAYNPDAAAYVGGSGAKKYARIFVPNIATIWTMLWLEVSVRYNWGGTNGAYHGKVYISLHHNNTEPYTWTYLNAVAVGRHNQDLEVYASDGQYIYILLNTTYQTVSVDKMLVGDAARSADLSNVIVDFVDELPTTYQTAVMSFSENPPKVNGHTVNSDVPSGAKFTDTTYTAGAGLTLSGTQFKHSNSITAGTIGSSSASSGNSTISIPYATYDAQGHITAAGTHTHTINNASTTASGLMSSSDKATFDTLNKIITLPMVGYQSLPSQSTTNSIYFQEWLAYMTTNYRDRMLAGKIIVAPVSPNSQGTVIGWCYTTSSYIDSETGLPRYCSFIYIPLGNSSPMKFGCNNYNFYYTSVDTTYTAANAAPGKIASSSQVGTSSNYARQDHTHGIDLATGDSNGQVKIAGTNVSVKGLGSLAYLSSLDADDVGAEPIITGGAQSITSDDLTANRALVSDGSGKVAVSAVTSTELGYLDGVTSAIQTQLNGKQASITGGASTIASSNLTASRALVSNSSGKVAVSAVTSTELGYLDGVTSAIQTQLNNKAPLASPALTGTPTAPTATAGTNTTQIATTAFVNSSVDALEVGGRNLLKDSHKAVSNGSYATVDYYFGDRPPLEDEIVTLQVKGTLASTKTSWQPYNSGGNVSAPGLKLTTQNYDSTTGIYTATGQWKVGAASNTYLRLYAMTQSQSGTSSIEWVKLERGDKATDWTLAPEDVITGLSISGKTITYKNQTGQLGTLTTQDTVALGQMTGTLGVGHGGTGATTFTSGALLIGNGDSAVGTRAIKNMTSAGNLGWTSATTDIYIPTVNTLAYWNGRYNSSASNLAYCSKGAFGNLAVKDSLTKSDVGLGNVDNKSSATIRSEITSGNVCSALGYAPVSQEGGYAVRTEFIYGTQTASTNAWTGVTSDAALYDGKEIIYFLPFAGTSTATTLNLTLSGGGTTGAKAVYFNSTSRHTTHYGQYQMIRMVYHKSLTIGSSTNLEGWWIDYARDTNDTAYNTYMHYSGFKTSAALKRYMICIQDDVDSLLPMNGVDNGYNSTTKALTTASFMPFGAILFYNSTGAVDSNAVIPNGRLYDSLLIDLRYSFNIGTTLTANKAVYIVAVPQSDGKAKLHATTPISQTLPTTADGNYYIYLGMAYSTYQVTLPRNFHPVFMYANSAVREISQYAPYAGDAATVTGHTVAKDVPSNALFTDHTYTAATSAPGEIATTGAKGSSSNYARQDHTHAISLATGDSNGQVKIAGENVDVKGLGALAYKASLSKSDVGLGNVDNKSSATIRGEITSQNVTTALGYTPVNKTGDTMSGALTLSAGSVTAQAGAIVSGTDTLTSESQVHVKSKSGGMYMYSTGNSSGNGARGIWLPAHGSGSAKYAFTVDTNNNVTFNGSLSGAASSNVLKSGDTMTGQLALKPASGEGGQICLDASTAQTTQGGIYLDQLNSSFRIFGKPSSDGSTCQGSGTILTYYPYNSGKMTIGSARVMTSAMFSLDGTTLTITIPSN